MQGGLAQRCGQGKARLIESAFAAKIVACSAEILMLDFLDDCADNVMEFGVELADLVMIFFRQQPAPFLPEPLAEPARLGVTDRRGVERGLAAEKIPELRLPGAMRVYGLLDVFF